MLPPSCTRNSSDQLRRHRLELSHLPPVLNCALVCVCACRTVLVEWRLQVEPLFLSDSGSGSVMLLLQESVSPF